MDFMYNAANSQLLYSALRTGKTPERVKPPGVIFTRGPSRVVSSFFFCRREQHETLSQSLCEPFFDPLVFQFSKRTELKS